MSPEADAELEALLERAGVEQPLRTPLARYGALVLEANRRFNLTGAKSSETLAEHLLDSLTVLPYVEEPYLDVGSGGGFPAIPLAIAAAIPVTMIEATAKKGRFLEEMLQRLGLRGAVVIARAEAAAHGDLRERFRSGTARALAVAPTVAELLLPFVAIGGAAVLQRGRLDDGERRSLEDAALMLGASVEREVPLAGDRRILVLRKASTTPARFPRRSGVPEKRPLCTGD